MNRRNIIIGLGILVIIVLLSIAFIKSRENTFTCTRENNDVLTFKFSTKSGEGPIILDTKNGNKVLKDDGELYFTYMLIAEKEIGDRVIEAKRAGKISELKKIVSDYEERYNSICK